MGGKSSRRASSFFLFVRLGLIGSVARDCFSSTYTHAWASFCRSQDPGDGKQEFIMLEGSAAKRGT
jgi:hypothetical protein